MGITYHFGIPVTFEERPIHWVVSSNTDLLLQNPAPVPVFEDSEILKALWIVGMQRWHSVPAETFLERLGVARKMLAASPTESTPRRLDRLEELGRTAQRLGRDVAFA